MLIFWGEYILQVGLFLYPLTSLYLRPFLGVASNRGVLKKKHVYPSSHNHGLVDNGCISNRIVSFHLVLIFHMIMGRVLSFWGRFCEKNGEMGRVLRLLYLDSRQRRLLMFSMLVSIFVKITQQFEGLLDLSLNETTPISLRT